MFARSLRSTLRKASQSSPRSFSSSARSPFWSSSAPIVATHLSASSIPSISPELLLPLLAALLIASDSEDPSPDPPWTPTDMSLAGKGIGCLAARPLARGELLIAERPLCVWPQGLSPERADELYQALGEKEKKVFDELAITEGKGVKGMSAVLARRATNGFSVTLPGTGANVGMIFPRIARLNHSCSPNASQTLNLETLRMEVYTITPIATSTEINIEYLPQLIIQPHATRQLSLQSSFGFDKCLCSVCTAPPEEIKRSDDRRLEIKSLSEGLIGGRSDRGKTLGSMERIRVLLEEEGYKGLPEFEDPSASNAYAVYASMHARSAAGGNQ
ncbi:hypothetical protein P7C70_g3941, partial [Phenoliferia sp. Uapishka_3]